MGVGSRTGGRKQADIRPRLCCLLPTAHFSERYALWAMHFAVFHWSTGEARWPTGIKVRVFQIVLPASQSDLYRIRRL